MQSYCTYQAHSGNIRLDRRSGFDSLPSEATLSKHPKKSEQGNRREDVGIPVWLEATESFYRKLNRVAEECELTRYEALNRGLDALVREIRMERSPLNGVAVTRQESATFRKTMGNVARKYWATVSKEEKRARAQKSAQARWAKVKKSADAAAG